VNMEKTGRKALFQTAQSNTGNSDLNLTLEEWANIVESAVEGDASARIDIDSVDGSLKSLGEKLNRAIEKISNDSADIENKKRLIGNAQKRYREILQQNPMPMLLVNKNQKIVVTNPAYEEMSGYTKNELRTMNLRDFRIEGKEGDGIRKALSTGVRTTEEVVVNLPSGTRTLEQHCIPVRNDADEITNVLLAFSDLTDLRQEMAEIHLLTKKAESFIKQNPQAIAVLAPDKSRIDLNKEYERVWRGSYEELMAKKLYDFDITMTGGDDFYASFETKRLAISDMELKWPNGDKTYVTLYQVPILDDNGDILVNYYIYQDRTAEVEEKSEIQQLQKKAESFIKQNPQAIAVLAPDKSRIDLNKEYERVWRGSYEELMAKKLYDFDITMTGGDDFYASFETKRLAISDMELKWPNGDKTYVTLYQVPILNDNGDILVNYYIYQDRTAEVEEKCEIQQLQKKAESFIKQNPQAIAVLAPDKSRIDLNKGYERVWRGSYEELMAKKLYDFDITMTGGDDFYASFETKRLAVTNMELKWPNGDHTYVTLYQVPILDESGEILVNYYIYQDLTKDVSVEKYLNNEVEKLKVNLEMFARGDLTFDSAVNEGNEYTTVVRDNFDQINGSIDGVRDAVGSLLADVGTLAEATVEGKLDTRVDASVHSGEFAKVVEGVNDTIDAMVGPLNVTAEYVDRISKGDIPEKITDDMQGDFNEIKNNLNACIDGLGGLVEANAVMQKMAENDYTTKVGGNYQGIFAEVSDATNKVLNNLNKVLDVVEAITGGDLCYLETYRAVGRRCENDRLIPSFVVLMENIQALVDDANLLAEAGVNGHLDVRADATGHRGAYGEVIGGINNTLDAMVGPLNVTAEYVDRISKGDIPEKVSDDMQGDFNEVKNNLNQCIDALNLVTEDIVLLADAGVAGELSVRADPSRHQGVFADYIMGLNKTLDASGVPLQETMGLLERMAVNDYTTRIEHTYPGDYAKVTENLNQVLEQQIHILDAVQHIAAGDLSIIKNYKNVGQRSKNDQIIPSFISMIKNIQAVVDDAEMLAQAGVNGQLNVRADATRHVGAYGEVIGGINSCLDAFAGPVNAAAEYVDRIAKGDIPERITQEYAGDFNEIKTNLNECIDAVNLLVADTAMLAEAGVEGRLDTRADASKHKGDFRRIVDGVNDTMDAVIGPLNVAADFIDDVATGSQFDPITDDFRGDYARIKNSASKCRDVLTGLVNDIIGLTQAAGEGRLDTRGNVEKYDGAWSMIVGDINNCLDAIVDPLNVSAEYVDRIAKGDIPEKITDVYAGDFNEIKNNLNGCIDAVNLLVVDTNMLVDAAAVGKLTARADVSQHAGDYAKIVKGINQTLDVINEPFREVNAAVAQLDVTADETTRGAEEIAKAAEQVALTSQQCADLGNSLIIQIEEVDRQVSDLSASNEEIASTSQEVHEHAVQTAEIGEKAQKLGAEANAKMNIVEHIAKQSVDGIEDLNSRMQEIDNVVKQVNDITNQINLLALNAAIEAARAGEHGRGFAVVAGEVRNLAVEAKAATGQIDQVIAGVQAISAKTAEAIGSAHTEIGSGVASVNETIEALNEIVKGSQDMRMNLDEIAKAIEDQANMANRIVEAMEESSRLTRENQGQVEELASLAEEASASTEEIGSSIREVKNMAGDLKQTMDKFEV
jgi:methyl-accepting chemotaxis protein